MGRRVDIDWEKIEAEYRIGSLTVRQIADSNGVAASAITRKAKKLNWSRDLSKAVDSTTKAVLQERAKQRAINKALESSQESAQRVISTVDAAVSVRVTVLESHQDLAEKMKTLSGKLYQELASVSTGDPRDIATLVAAVGQADEGLAADLAKALSLGNRLASAEKLSNVITKTAELERKAHGIKDEDGSKGGFDIDELLARVNAESE